MNWTDYSALVRVTIEKRVALLRRYLFNTTMELLAFYLVFVLAVVAGRQVAPTFINDSLEGLVVGFFVWTLAARAYNDVSRQIETEASWGTLEQLSMTPFGLGRVVFLNSLVTVAGALLNGTVILVAVVLTTGADLSLPVGGVLLIGLLTVTPVIGLGLVLGGLSLLYKRIGALTGFVQLFLVGFISLPLNAHPLVAAVPLTLGTRLVERVMTAGTISAVSPTLFTLLVVKFVVYLLVGFGSLRILSRVARRRGVLGQY